eukprot:5458566-Prymnesium_polylepis.1
MLAGEGYLLETEERGLATDYRFTIHAAIIFTIHTTNYLSQVQCNHCPGVVRGPPHSQACGAGTALHAVFVMKRLGLRARCSRPCR